MLLSPVLGLVLCVLAVGVAAPGDPCRSAVDDCTSLVLDNDGQAIFACNYDRVVDAGGLVFIHKRGVLKTGLGPSTTGAYAQWRAEYAGVVFSLLGYQHAWAGMNEAGLTGTWMAP